MDSNSVLRIKSASMNGSNIRLTWEHSHVDPAIPPICIQRRTNMVSGGWEDAGEKTAVDGTNIWDGVLFPRVFYRLTATNMP